jgi:CheY-like chemotaxis protein
LLVEDNTMNQQLAVELLESKHAEVHVAQNGREAIDRLVLHPPDHYSVVLMDLQMPVMDGYEATRILRMDSRFVSLPIIALSAHAMADERERCQVLGMNGHLSKPIDPERLYEVLGGLRSGPSAARPGPTMPDLETRQPERAPMPSVPGLDWIAGLRHTDGKEKLYVRLLRRFANDYSKFGTEMTSLLQLGEFEELAGRIHTLKGLAATLGALEVEQAAAALERAIQTRDGAAAREALSATADLLGVLIGGIEGSLGAAPGSGTQSGTPEAHSSLTLWLPRFCELLSQADVEACQIWEARQSSIGDQLPREIVIAVSDALSSFEFDAALRLITETSAERIGSSTALQ